MLPISKPFNGQPDAHGPASHTRTSAVGGGRQRWALRTEVTGREDDPEIDRSVMYRQTISIENRKRHWPNI